MAALPIGLQRLVRDQIRARWAAAWPAPSGVPVHWRQNDGGTAPDIGDAVHFVDIELDFGAERVVAFGGGRGASEMRRFGSIVIRVMAAVGEGEDTALDLLAAAEGVFRSFREGRLSFIGEISGFDQGNTEDGNWSMRASIVAWEYRFQG